MQLLTDKFAMKDLMTPSEWAEANVQIPPGNARPGPISFRDAPFQKSVLDAVADPMVERITMQWGAQVGKTMVASCALGYFTDEKPLPQMMMQPTETDMKKWISAKFEPVLDANPRLKDLYAPPRGREGVNNSIMKEFRGGYLVLAWAGSPNTMRGMSAPIIVCDEVDGYEYLPEGHPVDLLWRRAATFGSQRKLIELSTPTVVNESRIEQDYLAGDMRQYEVICPKCANPWIFDWAHVKYDPEDASTALIACPECDSRYTDLERIKLVRYAEADGGGWKAKKQTKGHLSFQISALYSPLQRMQDLAQAYIDTGDEPEKLATFYNTCMGVTWEKTGETAERHELEARCEDYAAPVPKDVRILTAGIDVQTDRLECEVVGWGEDEESWNIAYEIFHGDTSNLHDQCFKLLVSFLRRGFGVEGGGKMFVSSAAIDSGFNTLVIYQFAREQSNQIPPIHAVKGIGGWNREVIRGTKPQMTYKGYRPALFSIGVDIVKRIIMQRFNIALPGPGYCHFPQERAEGEYFDQLTQEVLLYDPRTGKRKWEKKDGQGADNEALDCRVYSYAALHIVNPDLAIRHGFINTDQKTAPGRRYESTSFRRNL